MFLRTFFILSILTFAFGVLFISITQTAQVRYSFNSSLKKEYTLETEGEEIVNYYFPYAGRILPGSPLWPLKALRDRLWLLVTPNHVRRAELNLLYANKRIVYAQLLFKEGKPELGFSVLTKAEKYLKAAFTEAEAAQDTSAVKTVSYSLAQASLKHRELIRDILKVAPDDAKPEIVKVEDYNMEVFNQTRDLLLRLHISPPDNPFEVK